MRWASSGPILIATALALGGCSIADSLAVPTAGARGCHSDLGAYFLPRDYMHVEVRQTNPVTPADISTAGAAKRAAPTYEIALIEQRTKADRTRGFCLDYLASITSNDYLEVKREEGLLIRVGTTNRTYVDLAKDAPQPSAIDSEDKTTQALANDLIRRSLPDSVDPKAAVTYPWVDRPGTPDAAGKPTPEAEDQRLLLLCKQQASLTKKDPLAGEFCDGATPIDNPTPEAKAKLLAYFTSQRTPRPDNGLPTGTEPQLETMRRTLRRVVYKSGGKDYPSGGYRGTVTNGSPMASQGLGPPAERDSATIPANSQNDTRPHPDSQNKREVTNLWATDTGFSADYDPASPVQAAVNNSGLQSFGYCVLLNDGRVDLRDRDAYCDDPLGYARRKSWNLQTGERFEGFVSYEHGLLYRPRINYTLYVFRKKHLKLPGGWQLDGQHLVSLPNLSPMISVGVKRTLFADRNTIVEFDRGSLVNIAVRKNSELVNALEIPLSLVQRLSALPTNIVKIRIRNTDSTALLAQKQKDLLDAEISYNESLKKLRDSQASSAETNNPNQ